LKCFIEGGCKMLLTNIFDTHESFKILTQSGFSKEQAEGQVKVITNLIEGHLATKNGLHELENIMSIKLKELENKFENNLKELENKFENNLKELENKLLTEILHTRSEIIKWVAGLMVAQAAIFAAMLKIFSL